MHKYRFMPLVILLLLLSIFPANVRADVAKNFETALTKGSYALENDDAAEAVRLLQTAVDLQPEDHTARLLLGIAQARQENQNPSRSNLLKALRLKPNDQRTLYELGISFLKTEEVAEARDFFADATEVATDPKLTTAARNYLAKLPKEDTGGKFRASANIGVQHDSNVILEPDDPIINAKHDSDWRELVLTNLQYLFAPGKKTSGMVSYSFYQSIHNRLDEFNTQQHQFTLQVEYRFAKGVSFLGLYRLPRTYVDDKLYSNFHTLGIGVKYKTAPNNRIEAHFTHDWRKFFNTSSFSSNDDRSGGFSRFTLNDRYNWRKDGDLMIGYVYELDRTNQSFWDYYAHQGSIAINQKFRKITTGAKARLQTRSYKDNFPGFSDRRKDTMQEYSIDVVWKVADNWNVSLSDIYTINKSDLSIFEYKRNIFGLFVRATL